MSLSKLPVKTCSYLHSLGSNNSYSDCCVLTEIVKRRENRVLSISAENLCP